MLCTCLADFLQGCNKVVYLAGARSTATSDLYRVEQQGVQNLTQALLVRVLAVVLYASPLLLSRMVCLAQGCVRYWLKR